MKGSCLCALALASVWYCVTGSPHQTINQWSSVDPTCLTGACVIYDGSDVSSANSCLQEAPSDCQFTGNYNVSGVEDAKVEFCAVTFRGLGYWAFPLSQFQVPHYLSTTDAGRGWFTLTMSPTLQEGCTYTFSEVPDFGNATTCGIPEAGPTSSFTSSLGQGEGVLTYDYRVMRKYLSTSYGGLVTNLSPASCGQAVNGVYLDLIGFTVFGSGKAEARAARSEGAVATVCGAAVIGALLSALLI
eukprot:Gregarina_sp_Pseudo_9__1439@NODE_1965_length_1229_cov_12_522689_g1820_i0_p1_GENE_NODE_1965_length_1229_cov_12_522689_g1820_i0NODE_1965_length_1229_cov_12_522689_g1820_i0_p1_ORF_typecomplete_len244_score32_89DMT_YdcZ/PF04657_13/1_1e02DMT_YdcZ/PF04657_13/0_5_NODE_1965_length_1229_cov_12_522689_g1820_i04061137